MEKTTYVAAVGAALTLALTGLAVVPGLAPSGPGADLAQHVHIASFTYDPSPVTVRPGTTVTWDNHDSARHSVTATDGSFDSGLFSEGESWTRTFMDEGEWTYFCTLHPSMEGVIRVETPPAAPPANEAPTVAFTAPANGTVVHGVIAVEGTAGDADGNLTRLEVALDDAPFEPLTVATTWFLELDTRDLVDGTHRLTARVTDDANATAEAVLVFTVDNPEYPDLTVDAVTTRGNALKQTITVRVGNDGEAPAGAFTLLVEYAYKDAWHVVDAPTVPGVGAGRTATVTVEWDTSLKLGSFPLRVTVDSGGVVDETDESDNTGTGRAIVGAGVPATDLGDP